MSSTWKEYARLHVAGTPKAQPRVKAFRRGAHAGVFTPPTADSWKALVMMEAAPLAGREIQGPVSLEIYYRMAKPKSRKPSDEWVTTKPDLDNLEKAVMDAITAMRVWRDDSQVARKYSEKLYQAPSGFCGAEIIISTLQEEGE